jgi:hypothetical protein
MAFCTTCGATVTGAFCNQCGTRADAAAASSSAGPSVAPGQPYAAAPAQPFAAPPAQPGPRKTSPLVWVLVVVLGLFVLGGIGVAGFTWFVVHKVRQAGIDPDLWRRNPGLAAGKLIAATNPDLDVVRTDDNAGTITLRDRHTGKETTITFDQARQGKFTIRAQDENGKTASLEFGGSGSKPPAWVPDYPGSHPAYSIRGSADSGEEGGNFTFTTDDPASKVMSFYQDKTREMGMEAKVTTTTPDGGMMVATREGDERSLTIVVGGNSSHTSVNVTYTRKR